MNYPYANGMVKAIEDKILDKNRLARLLKIDKEKFFDALLDMGYGETGSTVGELIASELEKVRNLIDSISPNKKMTDLFFLTNDVINIKIYYKTKFFSIKNPSLYAKAGNLEKEDLQKAIFEGDYSNLPKTYQKFFKELDESLQGVENPRILSTIIDNALFAFIASVLKFRPGNALSFYYQSIVDFQNVLGMIRSINLGWDLDNFLQMFIKEGTISETVFSEVYEKNEDLKIRAFRDYYQEKISYGLKVYYENKNLDALERYFDQILLEMMKVYRDDAFDIGPMIYYYLLKQAEAKNIRLIYGTTELGLGELIDY